MATPSATSVLPYVDSRTYYVNLHSPARPDCVLAQYIIALDNDNPGNAVISLDGIDAVYHDSVSSRLLHAIHCCRSADGWNYNGGAGFIDRNGDFWTWEPAPGIETLAEPTVRYTVLGPVN